MIPAILFVILVVGVFAYLYHKGKLGVLTDNEDLDVILTGILLLGWFFFAAPGVAILFGYNLPILPDYTNITSELLLIDIIVRWLMSLAFLVAVVHEEWKEA